MNQGEFLRGMYAKHQPQTESFTNIGPSEGDIFVIRDGDDLEIDGAPIFILPDGTQCDSLSATIAAIGGTPRLDRIEVLPGVAELKLVFWDLDKVPLDEDDADDRRPALDDDDPECADIVAELREERIRRDFAELCTLMEETSTAVVMTGDFVIVHTASSSDGIPTGELYRRYSDIVTGKECVVVLEAESGWRTKYTKVLKGELRARIVIFECTAA